MGKVLAVWSDVKKSGKSVVAYMLSKQIREMAHKDLRILVCCLNRQYTSLYRLMGADESDTGLEDLINYEFFEDEKSETLKSIIPEYNGIYFLGSYRMSNSYAVRNTEKYARLFQKLQNDFDLVIFDTVSGMENVLTNMVLKKADMLLKLYNQDNESIRELSRVKDGLAPYNQDILYLMSKYRNIYPRVTDIKRKYGLKKVYSMEYCETLQEMKNKDSLHLYLQRETKCNNSAKRISKYILEALGLIPQKGTVKEKPRWYLRSFRGIFQSMEHN